MLVGAQARTKRKAREMRQHATRETATLMAAKEADPALMALIDERTSDPRAVAAIKADWDEQVRRLTAAGWRNVARRDDGLGIWDARGNRLRLIHSVAAEDDGEVWAHVSVSNPAGTMPSWYDIREAGWLCYPDQFGVIVVAAESSHVNIGNIHHIWYRLTGDPAVPDFSHGVGSI